MKGRPKWAGPSSWGKVRRMRARSVRDLRPEDAPACDLIVAGLPEWFGNAQGIRDCREAVRSHPGLVSDDPEGVAGFVTWSQPRERSAEITRMAVRRDARRHGHGRALVDVLIERLGSTDVRLLLVKTLSDRDHYEPYAQTRAFYDSMGFLAATDLDIWGPENPALLFVRPL